MISKKMTDALNKQINRELYSSYLYLAMSACATSMNFKGAGQWFAVQAQEENGHAMKFYKYLLDQGAEVALAAIDQPAGKFKSMPDMFEATLKHERSITEAIHKLMELAVAEKDHATQIFLQWFVSEQVEEEANAAEVVAQLKMIGSSMGSLFMIDHQLGKRGK